MKWGPERLTVAVSVSYIPGALEARRRPSAPEVICSGRADTVEAGRCDRPASAGWWRLPAQHTAESGATRVALPPVTSESQQVAGGEGLGDS